MTLHSYSYQHFFRLTTAALLTLFAFVVSPGSLSAAQASETRTAFEVICAENDNWRKPTIILHINAYLKTHPDSVDVLCFAGRYYINHDQPKQAKIFYEHAAKVQPKHARAVGGLSYCYLCEHNYKAALDTARRAVALDQIDPIFITPNTSVLSNLEVLYRRTHDIKNANQTNLLVKAQARFQEACDLRERGVLDQSEATLTKLIKDQPKMAAAYLLRGVIRNNKSQYAHAISDFDTCIALQPTFTTPYYLRGDSYFELGDKQKAIDSWRSCLAVKPICFPGLMGFDFTSLTGRFREHFEPQDQNIVNSADLYFLIASAESDLKQYAGAVKDYSACALADPGEYKAYFERARIYERLNLDKNVLADLEHALRINPRCIEALLERAKLNEKQHEYNRALSDYSLVISINPGDFGPYILRAELAYRIKNYEQALSDYSQAIRLSPSDDDPVIGRARVYTAFGRYDDALADYRHAITLNPQDRGVVQDAINKLAQLKKKSALTVR